MKRNNASLILVALLAFLTLGAMQAQAIIVNWRPVGITLGQTARVTTANIGTRAITLTGVTFLDSEGAVLAQFQRQVINPGKMMSFDLNADDIIREGNRIQIRVIVEGPAPHLASALSSLEVFNNADGKTTVFIGDPGI